MSSLFIGNLARGINEKYLEEEFQKVASCTFRFKVTYKEGKDGDIGVLRFLRVQG